MTLRNPSPIRTKPARPQSPSNRSLIRSAITRRSTRKASECNRLFLQYGARDAALLKVLAQLGWVGDAATFDRAALHLFPECRRDMGRRPVADHDVDPALGFQSA